MTLSNLALAAGAAYGLLGVALGAFGAHALKKSLTVDALALWRTAVEYQFWHALALLAIGFLARDQASAALKLGGAGFAIGVLLFSGSLYLLALSGVRGLGAVTPVGGLLLLVGWAALLYEAVRR
jgi:uncharacterized membrane protein YgdD (TMEM256/DUF423 family)